MPSLIFRDVHGKSIGKIDLSQREFDELHTITVDRDKHRLYFSLKYTFHAELKDDEVPREKACQVIGCDGTPEVHEAHQATREPAKVRSKSQQKRVLAQTRK